MMQQAMAPTVEHVCPANRCSARIPSSVVMCRRHWLTVPQQLRDRVLNERTRRPAGAAFRNALADAILFVDHLVTA